MTRKWIYPVLLTGLFALLIHLSLPAGCVYGSTTDWLSQHTALAETIRTAMQEQHTLLPAYLPLGGGSNGFQFSYYGYLRPDILIGCLLPAVPMYKIVIAYALGGCLLSVLLFYLLLRRHRLSGFDSFMGSVLFLTASCFFHTHRQLMFVNYMPFLLLALLSVKKSPRRMPALLPLWMLLICLHSFYYAPACFVVIGWYWAWLSGRYFFKPWFVSCALGGFLAFALLLPTGLSLLEHRRASASGDAGLTTFFEDFQSLLYSSYGLGVTLIVLYLVVLGVAIRKYRAISLIFLLLFLWGGISYLLNATLYARAKILMPFLPLLLLHCALILSDLKNGRASFRLWPFPLLFAVIFRYLHKSYWTLVQADFLFLLAVVLLAMAVSEDRAEASEGAAPVAGSGLRYLLSRFAFLCLLIMPCLFFLRSASKEKFVTQADMDAAIEKPALTLYTDSLYRYDSLVHPLVNGNRDASSVRSKSSMYSSVYSNEYSRVYYDYLKTPVQINNRLAILTANNPFLLNFMGIRYLETSPSQVPAGYRVLWENDTMAVSENESVLPVAYLTSDTMTDTLFNRIKGWEQAEALTRTTVIPDEAADSSTISGKASSEKEEGWRTKIRYYQPLWSSKEIPATVQLAASGDSKNRSYDLKVTRDSTVILNFQTPVQEQLLLLRFDVVNHTGKAVTITINGVKNKLSAPGAAYPNGNGTFQYQFLSASVDGVTDSGQGITKLKIKLPKGHYTLKNIRFGLLDASVFQEKAWTAVEALDCDTTKNEILACKASADTDCWFVTSIPMQKGMKLYVDEVATELYTVNTAFAGAKLPAGEHEIRLCLTPPGMKAGIAISGLAGLVWLAILAGRGYRKIRR